MVVCSIHNWWENEKKKSGSDADVDILCANTSHVY